MAITNSIDSCAEQKLYERIAADYSLNKNKYFIVKMKYELMRYDVQNDIDHYHKYFYEDRSRAFSSDEYIVVPKIIMILSNKCSLSCDNCSMLMPKYDEKWEIEAYEAIYYFDNFLRGADEVLNLNLVGGEPLLYNDLPTIIDYYKDNKKIKQISIYTNGTILPNEQLINSFRHNKVEVVLSDYGNVVQMAKFVETLEINKIRLTIRTNSQWIDFGNIHNRGKSDEILKYEFENCLFSYNCKTIYNNKVFVCERAARMHMISSDFDSLKDYVTLPVYFTDDEIRQGIKQLLNIDAAESCNFCDAGKKDPIIVPAGEQIGAAIKRSQYTIVRRDMLNKDSAEYNMAVSKLLDAIK